MTTSERPGALTAVDSAVAAGLMFIAAASVAGLALAAPAGTAPALSPSLLAAVALALVLVASGVEGLWRRHFAFAVAVPVLMALACAGYVVSTGQWAAWPSVALYVLVVASIWSRRDSFQD